MDTFVLGNSIERLTQQPHDLEGHRVASIWAIDGDARNMLLDLEFDLGHARIVRNTPQHMQRSVAF